MSLLYIIVVILGFILPIIHCIFINKKFSILKSEYLFYSYILFLLFFLIFAKLVYLLLTLNIDSLILLINGNIINILKFILSGYSFIGGIIGGVVSNFMFSKIANKRFLDILFMYVPVIILMYSILKIGCYIKGCCGSNYNIPIQLIESFLNFILYIFLLIKFKNKNTIIGIGVFGFGIFRFVISLLRVNPNNLALLIVEIFCIICIIIGIKFLKNDVHIF